MRKALQELCDDYWKVFKGAELKHNKLSEGLKIYSDGERYIKFYPVENCEWQEVGIAHDNINFQGVDISEASFYKALKFIRKEMKNPIIDPLSKKKEAIKDLKAQIKRQKEELKNLTK